MAKSDLTLLGIPTRCSPFSIIKIRYNISALLFTKVVALVVQIILEKQKRNIEKRWNKHERGIDKNLECFKHLQQHLNHGFQWSILSIAPRDTFKRKILEAYFFNIMVPSLNSQMNNVL